MSSMSELPKELLEHFGVKSILDIEFVNLKTLNIEYKEETIYENPCTIESVKYITILDGPCGPSIDIERIDGGRIGTQVSDIKKIIVMD